MKRCVTIWLSAKMNRKCGLSPRVSPRSKPDKARVVAGVAGVAITRKASTSTTAIIQWLKKEGAQLYVAGNTLCFRPTDWAQFAIVNAHWRALFYELAAVDQEQENGSGR